MKKPLTFKQNVSIKIYYQNRAFCLNLSVVCFLIVCNYIRKGDKAVLREIMPLSSPVKIKSTRRH